MADLMTEIGGSFIDNFVDLDGDMWVIGNDAFNCISGPIWFSHEGKRIVDCVFASVQNVNHKHAKPPFQKNQHSYHKLVLFLHNDCHGIECCEEVEVGERTQVGCTHWVGGTLMTRRPYHYGTFRFYAKLIDRRQESLASLDVYSCITLEAMMSEEKDIYQLASFCVSSIVPTLAYFLWQYGDQYSTLRVDISHIEDLSSLALIKIVWQRDLLELYINGILVLKVQTMDKTKVPDRPLHLYFHFLPEGDMYYPTQLQNFTHFTSYLDVISAFQSILDDRPLNKKKFVQRMHLYGAMYSQKEDLNKYKDELFVFGRNSYTPWKVTILTASAFILALLVCLWVHLQCQSSYLNDKYIILLPEHTKS